MEVSEHHAWRDPRAGPGDWRDDEPIAGRALTSADDAENAPLSAVIGERLWERSFGRRPDAIGKSVQLNNQLFTIVGVAPARFTGRSDASEVWSR